MAAIGNALTSLPVPTLKGTIREDPDSGTYAIETDPKAPLTFKTPDEVSQSGTPGFGDTFTTTEVQVGMDQTQQGNSLAGPLKELLGLSSPAQFTQVPLQVSTARDAEQNLVPVVVIDVTDRNGPGMKALLSPLGMTPDQLPPDQPEYT